MLGGIRSGQLFDLGDCEMLVLSRRESEVIEIGENIRVTITRIEGSRVRVGIDAPREVQIRRPEALLRRAG